MNVSKLQTVVLTVALAMCSVQASISLRVFSREEAVHEHNISKPRIYIENIGTEPVSSFYYHYYFRTENNKTPVLEDYYTPNSAVTLEDLEDGLYRVRYHFSGVTLAPGEVLPNTDGNVVGLRYHDWSAWDKTNDPSNNASAEFALNGQIPVFLSDGTPGHGNDLPDPENPPQPPAVAYGFGDYAVFSSDYTDLRDRSLVRGGNAGSARYTEAGCDAVLEGSLLSGGNVFLRERARIEGGVTAQEQIHKQNNIVISGEEREHAQINFPEFADASVEYGTEDITVGPNDTAQLDPGRYRNITVYANAVIHIAPGVYEIKALVIEPDVKITFESGEGLRTEIQISDDLRIGDRVSMGFENEILPLAVSFYSAQSGQLRIGTDAVVYGLFTAPNADIHVSSRTTLYGAVRAKRVVVKPEAVVCKPPLLRDLWHSEWAYAPPFDPFVFSYDAVVPDVTSVLLVVPEATEGATVTVSSNPLGIPVELSGVNTDIIVHVEDSVGCGKTEYVLSVEKSAGYQIFVNENSPASPGQEDGNSWSGAFRCLQQAIDTAMVKGKEIWVAEGIYTPTYRTDSEDPRSATFLIQPGVEIKGGFRGNETDSVPRGSPYNTILSGDLAGNDDSLSMWPPAVEDSTFVSDNAYHVVTLKGSTGAKGIRLEGLLITGGVADGEGENSVGAGLLNHSCSPTIVFTGFRRNIADSSGAGIMDKGGFRRIENSLFEENFSLSGNGAGLYTTSSNLTIDASVFDGNQVKGTEEGFGGGAIYAKGSVVHMVNCVLTRNRSQTHAGALFNNKGTVSITNCTFAANFADSAGQSILNVDATAGIVNTILWNTQGRSEVEGDGFTITYSCVTGGYEGEGNIDRNPLFRSMNNPGGDGGYGTRSDGLQLLSSSPCRNTGNNDVAPEVDLLTRYRPIGSRVDMGAYESLPASTTQDGFGYINPDGIFIPDPEITVLDTLVSHRIIHVYAKSNLAYVGRVLIENTRRTRSKTEIYTDVYVKNSDGTVRHNLPPVRVRLFKVGETPDNLIFQTRTRHGQGKPIIFVS